LEPLVFSGLGFAALYCDKQEANILPWAFEKIIWPRIKLETWISPKVAGILIVCACRTPHT